MRQTFSREEVGFEPFIRNLNSTHPHSGDRLRALGLSAKVSEEAGAQLRQLLEDRVKIRLDLLCCPLKDEERSAVLIHRFRNNWTQIWYAGRLCSVHPREACKVIETLGDGQTYQELFRELLTALKRDEQGKEGNSSSELLAVVSNAETITLYETAIMQECATIGAVLREVA